LGVVARAAFVFAVGIWACSGHCWNRRNVPDEQRGPRRDQTDRGRTSGRGGTNRRSNAGDILVRRPHNGGSACRFKRLAALFGSFLVRLCLAWLRPWALAQTAGTLTPVASEANTTAKVSTGLLEQARKSLEQGRLIEAQSILRHLISGRSAKFVGSAEMAGAMDLLDNVDRRIKGG